MYGAGEAGAHIGGSVSGAVSASGGHTSQDGFLGLNWPGLFAAVVIGSVTAIATQLAVEHIRARRKSHSKSEPKTRALALELPVEVE